ncbi:MAG: mechanosensitive ion channel family protein, partial [Gammaproteobacteria bacterium]|nr:mechanosensitive ion channel family protein [Gammaproteobacteria bacterium]
METLLQTLAQWWFNLPALAHALGGIFALLILAVLADLIVKKQLIKFVMMVAERTTLQWDDILLEHKVLGRLAQTVPALVIYFGVAWIPDLGELLPALIRNVALAYLALMFTLSIGASLTAVNAIYSTYPIAKERPIKGYIQVINIIVYVLGA